MIQRVIDGTRIAVLDGTLKPTASVYRILTDAVELIESLDVVRANMAHCDGEICPCCAPMGVCHTDIIAHL